LKILTEEKKKKSMYMLVPFSKLGEKYQEINKYLVAGTSACLMSHETKVKNPAC
jgi:hypothetical protein